MKTKMNEKRKYQRFLPQKTAILNFAYSFEARLDVSPFSKQKKEEPSFKYDATVKDISVEGLCFHSPEKLRKGEKLRLEVYIPGGDKPVHMEGNVRWSKPIATNEKDDGGYATGVKLTIIEKRPVHRSIHFDEAYHIYWSDVLESIIGQFKTIQQKRRGA